MDKPDPRLAVPLAELRTCRSCGDPVFWRTNRQTNSRAPINAIPAFGGNVTLYGLDCYEVWGKGKIPPADLPVYTSHYATCPDAQAWHARGAK